MTAQSDSPIEPSTPAREALLRIFRNLLAQARAKETGILSHSDPEFLHDYRVALRKLRSMAGKIQGVFPKPLTKRWRKTLGKICRATNTLRDLDVFLHERKTFEKNLPRSLHKGLNPFFKEIHRLRDIEARKVQRRINTQKYKTQMSQLARSWSHARDNPAKTHHTPHIGKVAIKSLRKSYRQICRIQKTTGKNTPDATLHDIRIQCKRLRYILESFGHFFPPDTVTPTLKNLKKLQTLLGRHNDTAVQKKYLHRHAKKPATQSDASQTLSLRALIHSLTREHIQLRKPIQKSLRTLCHSPRASKPNPNFPTPISTPTPKSEPNRRQPPSTKIS